MGGRKRILSKDIKYVLPDGTVYLKEGICYSKPIEDMHEEDDGIYYNEEVRLQEKLSEIDPDLDLRISY